MAARCGIDRIDRATLERWRAEAADRSLYVIDLRTPEEYQAGQLRGAHSVPGDQLVQETDRREPRVPGLDDTTARAIDAAALRDAVSAATALVVDLDFSRRYIQGHIPGARFAIRSRLADAVTKLPASDTIVLTSPDGRLASLAAPELSALVSVPVMVLSGGHPRPGRGRIAAGDRNETHDKRA